MAISGKPIETSRAHLCVHKAKGTRQIPVEVFIPKVDLTGKSLGMNHMLAAEAAISVRLGSAKLT